MNFDENFATLVTIFEKSHSRNTGNFHCFAGFKKLRKVDLPVINNLKFQNQCQMMQNFGRNHMKSKDFSAQIKFKVNNFEINYLHCQVR